MSNVNLQGKKVAVVGSRTFLDKDRLFKILTKNKDKIKLIVSGGADGADTLAVEWAKAWGYPYLVFPAKWRDPETGKFDRGAGFKRNWDIVRHSDVVLAFWDGESGGTANTIDITKQLGKPLKVFKFVPVIEPLSGLPPEPEKEQEEAEQQERVAEALLGASALDEPVESEKVAEQQKPQSSQASTQTDSSATSPIEIETI